MTTIRLDDEITKITGRQESGITLGLKRITKLLNELQNPHHKIKNIIHIAGTNGKFSTLSYIRSVLEETGYSCNSFISPHLFNFNERINLAGSDIDSDLVKSLIAYIAKKNTNLSTTYFEFITALAFLVFSQKSSDFLLLETGLGGRLDATNVIPKPLVSVITKIGYDHKKFLGSSIKDIAFEKAGIIKPNCCVFSAKQLPEVTAILRSKAKEVSAKFFQDGIDWKIDKKGSSYSISSRFDDDSFNSPSGNYSYQTDNSGLAFAVCKYLQSDQIKKDIGYKFNINSSNINKGLSDCKITGRLQKFSLNRNNDKKSKSLKHNDDTQIFLDAAHNPLAAKALLEFINHYKAKNYHITIICGFLVTKDWQEFLKIISSVSNLIYLVNLSVNYIPFVDLKEMSEYLSKLKVAHKNLPNFNNFGIDQLENLVYDTQASSASNKNLIVICGSLHLVAHVINSYNRYNNKIKWKKSTVDC